VAQPLYESIGVDYTSVRRPDPRIERQIHDRLAGATPVVNLGAGTGSYEPSDRAVVAVEPSTVMIAQRRPGSAPVVRAVAEQLPFAAGVFAGAMAVLTVHHWPDPDAGLAEVRRIVRGPVVVLTFDFEIHVRQWLITEYLPAMAGIDQDVPSPARIAQLLGGGSVEVVPVPHDCQDGFCHAWWRRPQAYLDSAVRAGISGIARLPSPYVDAAMARLADDLDSGRWADRHADLLRRDEIDAGYRLVVSP